MSAWNDREWWRSGDIEMYDTSTTQEKVVVIKDPKDGKLYSITKEDGKNIDLWAENGMTPDLVCRIIIGMTNKDPVVGNVLTILDEFANADISYKDSYIRLKKALKIIEGSSSAELGKDQPDPSK